MSTNETITLMMLLDPTRETDKAFCVAGMEVKYLPKSQVEAKPYMEDDRKIFMTQRMKRWLHPKSSNAQRIAHQRDPWKKNPDGTDFTFRAYFYEVTMPKWLANKGYNHWKTDLGIHMARTCAQIMRDQDELEAEQAA